MSGVIRKYSPSQTEYFLDNALLFNVICLLASLSSYHSAGVYQALINFPILIGLFMLQTLALYMLRSSTTTYPISGRHRDDQVVLLALRSFFGTLLVWMTFVPLCYFPHEQSPVSAYFVIIGYMLEGFCVVQVIKHSRYHHYKFFVCVMANATYASHKVYGAYHQATWWVVGMCLTLVLFNHLLPIFIMKLIP